MFGLPEKTRVNLSIKKNLLDKLTFEPELKYLFSRQVEEIIWEHKLTPTTFGVDKGAQALEIEVFLIKTKEKDIDDQILRFLDRKIDNYIIAVFEYQFQIQVWSSNKIHQETKESYWQIKKYNHTEWMNPEQFVLTWEGENLDEIYSSINYQIQLLEFSRLLDVAEKVTKAKSIIHTARKYKPLSQQEIKSIFTTTPLSDVEKEKICNSYLRVAICLALKFSRKCNRLNDYLDDCIADACAGVMKAIELYDINKNGYFSVYVQRFIWNMLEKQRETRENIIHLPAHIQSQLNSLQKVANKIRQEKGREPMVEDYSKALHISVKKIEDLLEIMQQEPLSLSTPIGEDEDMILEDFIEDKNESNPLNSIKGFLRKQEIVNVLATLSEREAKIICMRFGIDSGYPKTLEEVAKTFNVTRERIRQIEAKAIRKLRHPSRTKKLKDLDCN